MKIASSILDTVGNTPVVKINNLGPKNVNLYVKVESFNPMGSVKDRLALGVIEDAEKRGELKPGQTVVEATSGNTGIGLAMVCAQKGYPLVVTMAENFSIERRKLLRFLGAKVVLTPAPEKGTGMVNKAKELAEEHGWWLARQFENPANAAIHERTTAVEILESFDGMRLDYWVSGFGTGGTFNGVSKVLKAKSPATKIMICEPDNSAILASGIKQERAEDGSASASHPKFRPHLMQGWSPDFISKLAEEAIADSRVDGYLGIDGNFALQCSKDLAQKEGIFVGASAGATFAGALKIAEDAPDGSNILCMLPDTGERYLSTPLFESISEDMNEDELDISMSTARYRFDVSSAAAPSSDEPDLDDEAISLVDGEITQDAPVVMFALEWCEFCWSVRKVLKLYGIEFASADLDSVAYQNDNRGARMRVALRERTGCNTFPQVFIKGEFLGGCTDLFDGLKSGELQKRFDELGVSYDKSVTADPYTLLPGWLHPR